MQKAFLLKILYCKVPYSSTNLNLNLKLLAVPVYLFEKIFFAFPNVGAEKTHADGILTIFFLLYCKVPCSHTNLYAFSSCF